VFRSRKAPNYDLTCFLCQQCAEKSLKACLQEAGLSIRRTHDLVLLLELLLPVYASLGLLRPAATILKEYAIEFRYPGKHADRVRATQALLHCDLIREAIARELRVTSPIRTKKLKRKSRSSAKGRKAKK